MYINVFSVIIITIIIIAVIFYVKFHEAVVKHLLFKEQNVFQLNIFVLCVDFSYKQAAATTVRY